MNILLQVYVQNSLSDPLIELSLPELLLLSSIAKERTVVVAEKTNAITMKMLSLLT